MPQNRFALVGLGVLIGAIWGGVMWGLVTLMGNDAGARGLVFLVVSMAMMGGGVAAAFGAVNVKREGERISPRLRRRK